MIEWVIDALRAAETVAEIAVVVPSAVDLGAWADKVDRLVVSDASFIDNAIAGAEQFDSGRHVLGATGDLPALTPEAVDDFVTQSLDAGRGVQLPAHPRGGHGGAVPGFGAHLRQGRGWTGHGRQHGCVLGGSPEAQSRHRPAALRDAQEPGGDGAGHRDPVHLQVPHAAGCVSKTSSARWSSSWARGARRSTRRYASIGADVDKPIDVVVASRVLYQRSTGRNP